MSNERSIPISELKIDPEFRDLLPPLPEEHLANLEKSLIKRGYVGAPIYTWKGFIVDGHNRYSICKKKGINFYTEELNTEVELDKAPDEVTKSDITGWIIKEQLNRRNLTPGEKLAIIEAQEARIAAENKKRLSEAGKIGADITNGNTRSLQLEKPRKNRKSSNTDIKLAKLANVGIGTVARYKQVVKSGDQKLIDEVRTGKKTVNKAYTEVKKKMDHDRREEAKVSPEKQVSGSSPNQDTTRICIESKTQKSPDIGNTIQLLNGICQNLINLFDENLFKTYDYGGGEERYFKEVASEQDLKRVISIMDSVINTFNNYKERITED